MKRLLACLATVSFAFMAASGVNAATVVFFDHDNLFTILPTKVTDIASDSSNRVWFTTDRGITALSGTAEADGFPLSTSIFTPDLSSIAFGDTDLAGASQEFFFIGSNNAPTGLQTARLLATGVENDSFIDLFGTHSTTDAEFVNALAADDTGTRIWVATAAGLTALNLPTAAVDTILLPTTPEAVSKVVDADSSVVGSAAYFATTTGDLYRVDSSVTTSVRFTNLPFTSIAGLAMDEDQNLWVAERTSIGKSRTISKFTASALTFFEAPGTQPTPGINFFDPGAENALGDPISAYFEERDINDIAVNPINGDVWLATTKGAFFQSPDASGDFDSKLCGTGIDWDSPADDVDLLGVSCAGDGGGWHPVPQNVTEAQLAINENFGSVFLDSAGNAYLGSDTGIRAVIARQLSLSGTRFIGYDKIATVTLEDDTVGVGTVVVDVSVGSTSATIPAIATGVGSFTVDFGFTETEGSDATVSPHNFYIGSTSEDVDITVTYTYTTADGVDRTLDASATWANIVEFTDDAFIGGFCFIGELDN